MSSSDRSHDDLIHEIEQLKEELAALKESAGSQAAALLERGKERARILKDAVTEKLQDGWDCTKECIQDRPLISVLVAFGAGLAVGAYALRRR